MPKSKYWDRLPSSPQRRRPADYEQDEPLSHGTRPYDVRTHQVETISTTRIDQLLGQVAIPGFPGLGIGEADYGYARRRAEGAPRHDPYEHYDPTEHGNAD